MINKLSPQKDTLKQINTVINRMIKSIDELDKVTCNIRNDSGRTIIQIEIISKANHV